MSIKKISNIFTESELLHLDQEIKKIQQLPFSKQHPDISKDLGRIHARIPIKNIGDAVAYKLSEVANNIDDQSYKLVSALHVDYRNKYGNPNLPPHFDADNNDLIINFQLSSNTSWDLGLGLSTYQIEDNSALIFNGNHHMHWRPHKTFGNDEYVKMIFFRFQNTNYQKDYFYLDRTQDHEIFQKVIHFRNNLTKK
jgi:hypothetical protein